MREVVSDEDARWQAVLSDPRSVTSTQAPPSARGPVEQLHAGTLFQKPHTLADHRGGQLERGGRRGKRAEIDGFDDTAMLVRRSIFKTPGFDNFFASLHLSSKG
jgi:hypothetical protein